jgi:hypothetical protein
MFMSPLSTGIWTFSTDTWKKRVLLELIEKNILKYVENKLKSKWKADWEKKRKKKL